MIIPRLINAGWWNESSQSNNPSPSSIGPPWPLSGNLSGCLFIQDSSCQGRPQTWWSVIRAQTRRPKDQHIVEPGSPAHHRCLGRSQLASSEPVFSHPVGPVVGKLKGDSTYHWLSHLERCCVRERWCIPIMLRKVVGTNTLPVEFNNLHCVMQVVAGSPGNTPTSAGLSVRFWSTECQCFPLSMVPPLSKSHNLRGCVLQRGNCNGFPTKTVHFCGMEIVVTHSLWIRRPPLSKGVELSWWKVVSRKHQGFNTFVFGLQLSWSALKRPSSFHPQPPFLRPGIRHKAWKAKSGSVPKAIDLRKAFVKETLVPKFRWAGDGNHPYPSLDAGSIGSLPILTHP